MFKKGVCLLVCEVGWPRIESWCEVEIDEMGKAETQAEIVGAQKIESMFHEIGHLGRCKFGSWEYEDKDNLCDSGYSPRTLMVWTGIPTYAD